MSITELSKICKALGDENRFQIIQMLTNGEKCACKILERFEITQPTLSHHMKILSECNLVNVRKEGKWSYYSLNGDILAGLKEFINKISYKKLKDVKNDKRRKIRRNL